MHSHTIPWPNHRSHAIANYLNCSPPPAASQGLPIKGMDRPHQLQQTHWLQVSRSVKYVCSIMFKLFKIQNSANWIELANCRSIFDDVWKESAQKVRVDLLKRIFLQALKPCSEAAAASVQICVSRSQCGEILHRFADLGKMHNAAHAYRLLHPATMLLCATAPLRSRSEMLSNALLHNLIQWVSSSLLWSRIQEWCTWAGPWKGSFHLRHERVTCATGKGKKSRKRLCESPSYTNVASLSFPSLSVKLSTSSASTVGSAKKAAKKNMASGGKHWWIHSFTGEKRCTVDIRKLLGFWPSWPL